VEEPTFDIFRGTPNKDAVWIEAVKGLAAARERMKQIAAEKPGKYFLFSTSSQAILARIEISEKPRSAGNVAAAS
jgi:hypothetical protein